MNQSELLRLAKVGAEARITELQAEIAAIYRQFPDLRSPARSNVATRPSAPGRKRRKMSAAARKRIGDAQRKRWAALKARQSK
jgi:hypothetical protein